MADQMTMGRDLGSGKMALTGLINDSWHCYSFIHLYQGTE